jgi:endoglucanase
LSHPRNLSAWCGLICALGLASLATGCSVLFPSGQQQQAPPVDWVVHPIRVNTVGYLPDREKFATIVQMPPGDMIEVHDASDGSFVWSGPIGGPVDDDRASGPATQVWIVDFSAFCEEGEFYLEVPGLGKSASFRVEPDVFTQPFSLGMLGLHGQRCGTDVSITVGGSTWAHAACHTKDALLTLLTNSDTIKPSLHGWHDAGDYGKYTTNGAFTVGMLLAAWEHFQTKIQAVPLAIPEHGGMLPDFLAEVKWELDWLLTTQLDDGSAAHKVTEMAFEGFVMPDGDTASRYYVPAGTVATADVVAVMAQAARIYDPYDHDFATRCRDAAAKGYAYLTQHPTLGVPCPGAGSLGASYECTTGTGSYADGDDSDERIWAAAEMWETTGDPAALADFEGRLSADTSVDQAWDWAGVANLGYFTYLLSTRDGRDPAKLATLTTAAIASGDSIAASARTAPYGRGLSVYTWGGNGMIARAAMNLWVAYQLNSQDPKYLDAIAMQLDHLLGRNYYDRSQVTGLGNHPPLTPHHRPSIADSNPAPWPGMVVGGANPTEDTWVDTQSNPMVNEIAINWIAPFVYASAALLPEN